MKKLWAIILSCVMICSLITPVSATTENNGQIFREKTIISENFIVPELVGTTISSEITTFDYYNEIPVVGDEFEEQKTVYVTPTGQPTLGYEGGSGAFIFFFSSGGSTTTFTVTIDAKNFSFTAETGTTSSNGQGYGDYVPSDAGRHRFEFIKHYVIHTKRIDVYQYSEYKYSYYIHDPQYSLSHRGVKL